MAGSAAAGDTLKGLADLKGAGALKGMPTVMDMGDGTSQVLRGAALRSHLVKLASEAAQEYGAAESGPLHALKHLAMGFMHFDLELPSAELLNLSPRATQIAHISVSLKVAGGVHDAVDVAHGSPKIYEDHREEGVSGGHP